MVWQTLAILYLNTGISYPMTTELLGRLANLLILSLMLSGAANATDESVDKSQLLAGEKIYKQGLLSSGKFIPATIHGDIKVTGDQVICSSCHRKSGMGTTEGQQVVPAIAGDVLFKPLRLPTDKPPLPPALRPAYTRDTLKVALTMGIDANGKKLDPFMPRYEISDEELDSLILYLNTLSNKRDPGVTDTEIHFSTIIVEGNETRNKAMLDVFEAYIQQKNTETRHESSRAKNAPWHKEWMMKTYRKWRYHVWTLKGDPNTWQDQLDEYYRKQPVFAVVNGVVDASFGPVHQFCEDNGIPCLFPTTMLPTIDEDDFYTLYLNRGYLFEGEAAASYLATEFKNKKILHLTNSDDKFSSISAYGLRANLDHEYYNQKEISCVDEPDSQQLSDIDSFNAIAIHTDKACTDQILKSLSKVDLKGTIFLSSRLYGTSIEGIPGALKKKVKFIHSQEMPAKLNRLLARSTGWFRYKRILNPDEMEVQANAYFALKVTGDALKHIRGYFFRDYFIEKIEHTIDDVPYTSIYPRLSLAPKQRFSSRGYYVATIDEKRNRLAAETPWRAP
jgi:ABC-type branched-subunit amino acid transport system substrate-binding protein